MRDGPPEAPARSHLAPLLPPTRQPTRERGRSTPPTEPRMIRDSDRSRGLCRLRWRDSNPSRFLRSEIAYFASLRTAIAQCALSWLSLPTDVNHPAISGASPARLSGVSGGAPAGVSRR